MTLKKLGAIFKFSRCMALPEVDRFSDWHDHVMAQPLKQIIELRELKR